MPAAGGSRLRSLGRRPALPADNRQRILWVDDSIRKYYHAVAHLIFAGFEVATARGYYEAKQKLENQVFDYLILDFDLGEGTTGFDVVRDLLLAGRQTKIMFVTAYLEEAQRRCPTALQGIPIFDKTAILVGATSGKEESDLIRALAALTPAEVETSRASLEQELATATAKLRPGRLGRLLPSWHLLELGRPAAAAFTGALPLLAIAPPLLEALGTWVPPILREHALLHFLTGIVLVPAVALFYATCPPELRKHETAEDYYKAVSEAPNRELMTKAAQDAIRAHGATPSPSLYLLVHQWWVVLDTSRLLARLVIAALGLLAAVILLIMYVGPILDTTLAAIGALRHWFEETLHYFWGP